jgi:hypothetical protein
MRRAINLTDEPQVRRFMLGEVLGEMTERDARTAIEKRVNLMRECVGTFYPTILLGEIDEIKARFAWR